MELGLLTEEREQSGRRRRIFAVTDVGRRALREWLGRPASQPTELRDLALLQIFFADLEPTTATLAIAREQQALHEAQLADYEAGLRSPAAVGGTRATTRTIERWRGVTLRMGLLYERAAIEFWAGLVIEAGIAEAAVDQAAVDGEAAAGVMDLTSSGTSEKA